MKRSIVVIAIVIAIAACAPAPDETGGGSANGAGGAGGAEGSCVPDGCMTCDLDPSFYSDQCPEAFYWCVNLQTGADGRCPAGLEPLFCGDIASVPTEACVLTTAYACGEGVATAYCCSASYFPIGLEYYCDTSADCAPGTECLVATCQSFGPTNSWPDPYGTAGHCVYETAPDGTPCSQPGGDHCFDGACVGFGSAGCTEPTPVPNTSCTSDAQCDDTSTCTVDSCVSGACAFETVPAGTPCATGTCVGTSCCAP